MVWPFSNRKRKEREAWEAHNRQTLLTVLGLSDGERLAYWDTFAERKTGPAYWGRFFIFPVPPPPRPDHQHSYHATDTGQS